MKKLFLSALLLASALTAGAVRPMHKLFPVKQNDGSVVMLYKNGDGHLAFYTTEDDKVVVRDANGRLCYAQLNANGELTASSMAVHNLADRTAEETAFVSTITLRPTDDALRPLLSPDATLVRRLVKRAGNASTKDGLGKFGTNSGGAVPSNGNITIPVIMVAFQDQAFKADHTVEKISRYFNEEGYHEDNAYEVGSVKDYFKASSMGHFVPTFDVVAKVTLGHPYAYYGANSSSGSNRGAGDVRAFQMVKDAIAAATEQGVDFSAYEVDGTIPNVTIMYAGLGEATGGDENTIWPHELDLGPYYGNIGGHTFGSYFVGNEMYNENNIMGIGVFCHEFSHALGLPDWYVTDYSYSNDSPYGYWSVMDGGEYNGESYAPVGYTAYERSFMGWLDIKELQDAQSVTLENPKNNDAAYAVMFRNPLNNNEYFILENRQPDTWYSSQLGSGLLLTHITYGSSAWWGNTVNNNQLRKRSMVVTADGSKIGSVSTESSYGNPAHLFGNGVNYLESVNLYNGTKYSNFPFYKVVKHNDGTITFSFKDGTLNPSTIASDGRTFEKVTDLSQISSGDSVIFVNEANNVAIGLSQQGNFMSVANIDVDGSKAYGNADVLVFGVLKSSKSGNLGFHCDKGYLSATSIGLALSKNTTNALSALTFSDGKASVKFVGAYKRYLGYANPETYFTTYASDQGDMQVYRLTKATNGITTLAANSERNADNRIFTLGGQYLGTSLNGLPKGVYIQNGRKVVVK